MLKKLLAISWPLVSLLGCATTSAQFAPIGNCVTSVGGDKTFACVDSAGASTVLPWEQAEDLVCFHFAEFKKHEEVCHSP